MTTALKLSIIGTIVVVSVTAPLLFERHARVQLFEKQELLHKQTEELAQLTAENAKLSSRTSPEKPALSGEQLRELLQLRNEMGRLRGQTNLVQELREENKRLLSESTATPNQSRQLSQDELDEELTAETREAMRNICRELPGALQRFASEHANKVPDDFADLRKHFPSSEGVMPGLYLLEFVHEAEVTPSGHVLTLRPRDGVVVTEPGGHKTPDGKSARFYGFPDGRVIEVVSEDGHFVDWEKQNLNLAPSEGK